MLLPFVCEINHPYMLHLLSIKKVIEVKYVGT